MGLICGLAFYNFPATSNEQSLFLNSICASPGQALMLLKNNVGVICVALMMPRNSPPLTYRKSHFQCQLTHLSALDIKAYLTEYLVNLESL